MPLLGYITPLLSTKEPFYKILQNLAKTYGPVTGFYIGPKAFISVVGPEAVREALQNMWCVRVTSARAGRSGRTAASCRRRRWRWCARRG